jgi:predicted DNA-binding transcriptional regulator AlpA
MKTSEERVVRPKEVKAVVGLSLTEVNRRIKAGTFPPKRELGEQARGWLYSDLVKWMESRKVA